MSKYLQVQSGIGSRVTRCDRICFIQVVKRGGFQREMGFTLLREIYFLRADIDFGYFCSIAVEEYLVKQDIVFLLFFLLITSFSHRDFLIKIRWKLRLSLLSTIVVIVVIFIK